MASRVFQTPIGGFEVSYLREGSVELPEILFLHGWGANKELMRAVFSRHCENYRALYVDLPGFGASRNNKTLTTADYAVIVRSVLETLAVEPITIVGHSFGGKIAVLLDPPCLALISSAGIPKKKSLFVLVKIAAAKRFKFLTSAKTLRDTLRTSDARGLNENMYETLKNVVDEDFSSFFAKREKKTLIFWGRNDKTTPLGGGRKIHTLIKNSELFEYDGDHFFFSAYAAEIMEKIKAVVKAL
jgi:pimeloyl-ACP methyl ester carboxylesterase